LQQKDEERKKHELEASGGRYEMDGGNLRVEISGIPTFGMGT